MVDKSKNFVVQPIVTRSVNFDREWDNGIADWLASGVAAIVKEREEKYVAP